MNLGVVRVVSREPMCERLVSETPLKTASFGLVLLVCALFILSPAATVMAQMNSATGAPIAAGSAEDTVYRIGPGDVIAILTRKAPELSVEAVRVDQRGMIRVPMVDF